ncbi:MAG: hypothetical protein ACI956_001792, partial [Nonlabens sp.]
CYLVVLSSRAQPNSTRAAARGKCRVDSSGVLPVVREVRVLSAVLFLGSFSFSLEIVTDVEVKV